MQRGEVWWANLPASTGKRPVLVLSRDRAIQVREFVAVSQVTTVIRQLPVEVNLGRKEGMPKECVINCDVINTIPKELLVEKICLLGSEKMRAVESAIKFAFDIS